MPSPPISVVMPVNNGEAFLDEAVGSIRAQTFQDFELIIVDDGSRDATPEILRRHAVTDRRIRIVTQPQAGVVAALNNGIAASAGPYLARMDADDSCANSA
jgi:glycosyltransferase involved in cell wall biosynthesis